ARWARPSGPARFVRSPVRPSLPIVHRRRGQGEGVAEPALLRTEHRHPLRPEGTIGWPVPFPHDCHPGDRVVGVQPGQFILLGQQLEPAYRLVDLEELGLLQRTGPHGCQTDQREEGDFPLALLSSLIRHVAQVEARSVSSTQPSSRLRCRNRSCSGTPSTRGCLKKSDSCSCGPTARLRAARSSSRAASSASGAANTESPPRRFILSCIGTPQNPLKSMLSHDSLKSPRGW